MNNRDSKLLLKIRLDKQDVGFCALIALIILVTRYWQTQNFGLYEDDLTIIPRAMTMKFPELLAFIANYIRNLYGHARPLSDSMIYFFSYLGWHIAGFHGPYIFGFLFVYLNTCLFFFLVRRISNFLLAAVCTLAYCLFSADTTQAFLTHTLGLQPSLTLLLLAAHAYLSNRRVLSYLLAFFILFSYETPYLVFLGIPLLKIPWKRGLIKEMIVHSIILGVGLGCVFLLRSAIGEGRVSDLSGQDILMVPLIHSIQGSLVSLGTYILRPLQVIQSFIQPYPEVTTTVSLLTVIVLSFAGFWWLFQKYAARYDWENTKFSLSRNKLKNLSSLPDEIKNLSQMIAAGFVMLACAYPLTFTVRAYAISGRDTRVHAAAVVGAAIIVGCVIILLASIAYAYRLQKILYLLTALLFALLAGYGVLIQRDYSKAWEYQRRFWTDLRALIPDVQDSTVILVDPSVLPDSRQIGANTWNMPRILNQLFLFPSDWKNPPRVYRLTPDWKEQILTEKGLFRLDVLTTVAPPSLYGEFDPADIIFIENQDGQMGRRSSLDIQDQEISLKNPSSPLLETFGKGFLYDFMIYK
jgi:hypothetical protein